LVAVQRTLTNITFHEQLVSWNQAQSICQSLGQTLVSLETNEKYELVVEQLMEGRWEEIG